MGYHFLERNKQGSGRKTVQRDTDQRSNSILLILSIHPNPRSGNCTYAAPPAVEAKATTIILFMYIKSAVA